MISLAITHFERFDMLLESFADVLDDKRIKEVVISDDASEDGSWERMRLLFADEPKIRLHRNEVRLDCYQNKAAVLAQCSGWAVLFDSDNIMTPDYLDRLEAMLPWAEDTAYLPTFAEPHFDYRGYAGLTVTRSNVAEHMDDVTFRTALNTANHLCRPEFYVGVHDPDTDPHTADSIYMNYLWLAAGYKLHFVPGLRYVHRVHEGSHYQKNVHRTGEFAEWVEEMLADLR